MERLREIYRNISKTGWIIISLVVVLILLIIIGILSVRNGMDWWPFNNGIEQEIPLENEKDNEIFLTNVDRALQSAGDSVLSAEDVLSGIYENSYESATVFLRS